MNNWRDLVSLQNLTEQNGLGVLIYLTTRIPTGPNATGIAIELVKEKYSLDTVTLTEEEVGEKVEELLKSFPVKSVSNDLELTREKFNVAKVTRRGVADKNWNNVWYYRGSNVTDSPVIVGEHDGKFCVFKHPKFEEYGFVAE